MKILVCGGRNFTDRNAVVSFLTELHASHPISEIIHGGARGADTLASVAADQLKIPVHVFPANWKQYGNDAGPVRNRLMLAEGKPDLVVAFKGGRGTRNMIKQAVAAGVPVTWIGWSLNDLQTKIWGD